MAFSTKFTDLTQLFYVSLFSSLEMLYKTILAIKVWFSDLGGIITRSISDQGRHSFVACDPYTLTSQLGMVFLIT